MKVYFGSKTDPGRRPNNEDSHTVVGASQGNLNADGLVLVADGMGGRNCGEAASSTAVEAVKESLVDYLRTDQPTAVPVTDALAAALRKANSRVYALSQEDPTSQGMGTTLVAAVINGTKLNLAHVGDSRAYLLGPDGLEQITDDHSFVADQVRAGNISEDGAKKSRFRNVITRAVGIEPTVAPDLDQFDLSNAHALVVCTDGLTNAVSDEEIAHILSTAVSAQAVADQLVEAALDNGGKDNITVVVSRFNSNDPLTKGGARRPIPRPAARVADHEDSLPLSLAAKSSTKRKRTGTGATVLASVLCLLFLISVGIAGYFGTILSAAGYHFRASAPFVYLPLAPPPPLPPDLTHMVYGPPTKAFTLPVQREPLYVGASGTLSVLTMKNEVVTLSADGQVITTVPVASSVAAYLHQPATVPLQPSARDSQGDLYVANPTMKSIAKFNPSGKLLGQIAIGKLPSIGAISVVPDGTAYVIDSNRLWSIKATPGVAPAVEATKKPVPHKEPKKPAATSMIQPSPSGRGF